MTARETAVGFPVRGNPTAYRSFTLKKPYRLKQPLGLSYDADPDDVWVTKHNLQKAGFYPKPDHGMTEFPDHQMIDAVKQYQRENGLRVDGVMKPDGETERHMLDNYDTAMTYWCRVCGAPHGGVHSPNICWQCWNKGYR
ncbi:MAG: peptidoglycan-binding protein [Arenibacter algicola]|nr:peptidoglycan-binding protein [Arenibacter algicola]